MHGIRWKSYLPPLNCSGLDSNFSSLSSFQASCCGHLQVWIAAGSEIVKCTAELRLGVFFYSICKLQYALLKRFIVSVWSNLTYQRTSSFLYSLYNIISRNCRNRCTCISNNSSWWCSCRLTCRAYDENVQKWKHSNNRNEISARHWIKNFLFKKKFSGCH